MSDDPLARVPEQPPEDTLFSRVVSRGVLEGGLVLDIVGVDAARGTIAGEPGLVAIVHAVGSPERDLASLMEEGRRRGLALILVGGGDREAEWARAAVPTYTGEGIHVGHVRDDGRYTAVTRRAPHYPWLKAPFPASDWPNVRRVLAERGESARVQAEAVRDRSAGHHVYATFGLLAVCCALYGAEWAFHADSWVAAAIAMGALYPDGVARGEVWRLASSTFLHGDLLHLGMNMYVLWALGSNVERILGARRFLLLYAMAGLAGGLASLLHLEGYSLGASGALWGMMVAQAALAWRDTGLIPDAMRAGMRRGTLQNLVINILISFQPGVDWAAHLGGAIAGGLLVLTGLLTLGIPRLAAVGDGSDETARVPALVSAGAWLGTAAMAGGLVVALVTGEVWSLSEPTPERVPLTTAGWTAEIPDRLEPSTVPGVEGSAFGDIPADPALVIVFVTPLDAPIPPDERAAAFDQVERELGEPETGFTADGGWRRSEINAVPVDEIGYAGPNGLAYRVAVVLQDEGVVVVQAFWAAGARGGWFSLPRQVALSARSGTR
jgi:membrane associated rhomboid family serine protease